MSRHEVAPRVTTFDVSITVSLKRLRLNIIPSKTDIEGRLHVLCSNPNLPAGCTYLPACLLTYLLVQKIRNPVHVAFMSASCTQGAKNIFHHAAVCIIRWYYLTSFPWASILSVYMCFIRGLAVDILLNSSIPAVSSFF